MSDTGKHTGGCLCGAVRFSLEDVSPKMGTCHCGTCRRWASGPLFAVDCGAGLEFEGEENIGRFRSSDWAERGFCTKCGSNLFYRIVETDQYMLSVGLFDDQSHFAMASQVFIDEKPDHYAFANETRTMTGAEVFAYFAGQKQE